MANFTIKQNDTKRSLNTILEFNGSAVSIDAANDTVKFYMRNTLDNTVKVNKSANVVDGPNGEVEYDWDAEDTDTVGSFLGEFEVTYNNGDIETFPSKDYIQIDIIDDIG